MKEPLTRIELALIRVYRGAICPACGQSKAQRQPICKTCYFALDKKTQNALHARIDEDAFYDTYLQVIDSLIKKGVGKKPADMPAEARRALDDMGIADALSELSRAPVQINVRKRQSGDFIAYLRTDRKLWSAGSSVDHALANFIFTHADVVGVEIKCEAAK